MRGPGRLKLWSVIVHIVGGLWAGGEVLSAVAPQYEWVTIVDGPGYDDVIWGAVEDANGAVFIAGSLSRGGSIGGKTAPSESLFIARLDASGKVEWSVLYSGIEEVYLGDLIVVDDAVVVFASTPNYKINIPNNAGNFNGGLVCLAKSDGAFRWSKGFMWGIASQLAADPQNNIIFTGTFSYAEFGGATISSAGRIDALVGKVTPSGQFLWLEKGGGAGHDYGYGVTCDGEGNAYVVGSFSEAANFGGNVITGDDDGFLAKFAPDGVVSWARAYRGDSGDALVAVSYDEIEGAIMSHRAHGYTYQSSGVLKTSEFGFSSYLSDFAGQFENVHLRSMGRTTYIAGDFQETATAGGNTFTSKGGSDGLLACYGPDKAFRWAKSFGLNQDEHVRRLNVSTKGSVLVAGRFENATRFDNISIEGSQNVGYVAKIASENAGYPVISAQPVGQSVYGGTEATFAATVSSATPVSYQWYFKGQAIAGETNATLRLASVNAEDEGAYHVEVTNGAGTVRSASAQLVIRGALDVRVSTIAGNGTAGYVDAANGADARFNQPNGPVVLPDGYILLADGHNHLIRVISPAGAVATYAGLNSAGYLNGPGSVAKFNFPLSLTVARSGDAFVADSGNNVVRMISAFPLRSVSTFAGTGEAGYRDGTLAAAQFNFPNDMVLDGEGNLVVTEYLNHTVRKITPGGVVTTLAGNGTAGYQDGTGTGARLNQPAGIALGVDGNFYVTEWSNHRVRRVTPGGVVTTVAGSGQAGFVDGMGTGAQLNTPDGITSDYVGNLYITEQGNNAVRKISPQGEVTTVAGLGSAGFVDGTRAQAKFNGPTGIAWHPTGSLIVTEAGNHSVRKIEWMTGGAVELPVLVLDMYPGVTIFGEVGKTYRLEAAEEWQAGQTLDWVVLGSVTLTNAVQTWYDSQPSTRATRYYRAVQVN